MFLGGGSGKKRWSLGDRMGGGMDGGYRGEGVGGRWAGGWSLQPLPHIISYLSEQGG